MSSKKLDPRDFWRFANTLFKKVRSDISSIFNGSQVFSSPSDKENLFVDILHVSVLELI